MLTHIDLFSGIGGFALAAQWAGFKTVCFVEIDEYCQKVIKARFGVVADSDQKGLSERQGQNSNGTGTNGGAEFTGEVNRPILIPDIRNFDGRRFRGATLLTGGFPCQPFSCAGKRKGTQDNRHLWPEMRRVISEAKPTWVVGENVTGIVSMELDQVLTDLEMEGYTTGTVIIPACAVNAPHRRDRVWIIGYAPGPRGRGETRGISERQDSFSNRVNSDAPDAEGTERKGGWRDTRCWRSKPGCSDWDTPWPEVASRLCRVDDGVSNRVDRLKCLGNAIVPSVVFPILKAIREIELGNKT